MREGKVKQNKNLRSSYLIAKIMITLQLKNLWEIPTASGASSAYTTDFPHNTLR